MDLQWLVQALRDLDLGVEKNHLVASRGHLGVLWVEADLPHTVSAFPQQGELLEVAVGCDSL